MIRLPDTLIPTVGRRRTWHPMAEFAVVMLLVGVVAGILWFVSVHQ